MTRHIWTAGDSLRAQRVDPPRCRCTDCLTGKSRAATDDEWRSLNPLEYGEFGDETVTSQTLRTGATQIRSEWQDDAGTGDYVAETLLLVACWLDSEADRCDQLVRAMPTVTLEPGNVADWKLAHAFRVALAYCGDAQ